ncbi:putative disrupter of telomere silencing protein Dot5 [Paecilomyces variotii]|uniref:thioredoxin-dependent peroxiredoxin n=1 Tax=Byssochlamys spectabilis TaxID=264951 RepID=A0A443HZJ7_BYSSP|nr:putative disrupter of telomere silencing protein Dot5 [Paecilomyces variotii]RWQ97267.1 putative disrupter of telomere silencing protein Dot5 [Paecilomyces variotii]
MVELRKRKAPAEPAPTEKKPKVTQKAATRGRPRASAKGAQKDSAAQSSKSSTPSVGDTIQLDGFGGEIETHEGVKTTLKALVDESEAGVVLFTYPKASTPGCTRQACFFRDDYSDLTSTGLAIYGLSNDSPKANTTFKTKQNLPYPLLCDQQASLIGALGFKKAPKGTLRGVVVVDKAGKVLISEAGGPEATVNAVRALVKSKPDEGKDESKDSETKADGSSAPDKS